MAARRVRVEFIRFGLLLTLTVALISVAARYNDHGSGREQAARGHHPSASATPSGATTSGGSTQAPASQSPATTSPTASPSERAAGGPSGASGGGSGAGGSGQAGGVPTLPRTGGTQAIELSALAGLFIAAGTVTVRIARSPASSGQIATSAQAEQVLGSSESNRPGTS